VRTRSTFLESRHVEVPLGEDIAGEGIRALQSREWFDHRVFDRDEPDGVTGDQIDRGTLSVLDVGEGDHRCGAAPATRLLTN
jgi:hypothetical protein